MFAQLFDGISTGVLVDYKLGSEDFTHVSFACNEGDYKAFAILFCMGIWLEVLLK